jgi:riboflavin synthase
MGTVAAIEPASPGVRLVIAAGEIARSAGIGDSIAVNGCCLTVVGKQGDTFAFDAGEETLRRTNLGQLLPGARVNLERSLKLGDQVGGHLVTGHIDAVGTVEQRLDDREWATIWYLMPERLGRQMISKGSITVDGVSLTLVDVEEQRFSVALIPHTLQVTTLGLHRPGDRVNLETDVLAKYVEKQLSGRLTTG